jgi:hypothetical protein
MLSRPETITSTTVDAATTTATTTRTVRRVERARLAAALKANRLTASQRALLAFEFITGAAVLRLDRALAIELSGTNATYLSAVAGMTPAERESLKDGELSLPQYIAGRRHTPDTDIDRVVKALGPGRMMEALDRITQPTAEAAE